MEFVEGAVLLETKSLTKTRGEKWRPLYDQSPRN